MNIDLGAEQAIFERADIHKSKETARQLGSVLGVVGEERFSDVLSIADPEYVLASIDKAHPTLVITSESFSGIEPFLLPEVRAQMVGMNVLHMHEFATRRLVIENGSVYTTYAATVAEDDSLRYGILPEPVKVDAIEETFLNDESRKKLLQTDCSIFTHPAYSQLESKTFSREVFGSFVEFAPGISLAFDENDRRLVSFLKTSIFPYGKLVIKPDRGARGRGVSIHNVADISAIRAAASKLQRTGSDVVIEAYIEPFPIEDDSSFEREAIVRSVSLGSMCVDSLGKLLIARSGYRGQPIGVDTKDETKSIDWYLEHAASNGLNPDQIRADLISNQRSIRQHCLASNGSDFLVDREGKVWTVEINSGYTGVFDMFAELQMSQSGKLELYKDFAKMFSLRKNQQRAAGFTSSLGLSFNKKLLLDMYLKPNDDILGTLATAEEFCANRKLNYGNIYLIGNMLAKIGRYFYSDHTDQDTTQRIIDLVRNFNKIVPNNYYLLRFMVRYDSFFSLPERDELLTEYRSVDPEAADLLAMWLPLLGGNFGEALRLWSDIPITQSEDAKLLRQDTYIDLYLLYVRQLHLADNLLSGVDKQKIIAGIEDVMNRMSDILSNGMSCIRKIEDATLRRLAIYLAREYYKSTDNYAMLNKLADVYPFTVGKDSDNDCLSWLEGAKRDVIDQEKLRYATRVLNKTHGSSSKRFVGNLLRNQAKLRNKKP